MSRMDRYKDEDKKRSARTSSRAERDERGSSRSGSRVSERSRGADIDFWDTDKQERSSRRDSASARSATADNSARATSDSTSRSRDSRIGQTAARGSEASSQLAKRKKAKDEQAEYKKLRKKEKKKHSKLRVLFRIVLVLIVVGALAGGIYGATCIASAPTIHPDKIYETLDLSTNIYDDDGELFDTVYYLENRKVTAYKDMPENLVNAFIAVEDKTFWKHHGFNFKRMIGAVLQSFTGGGIHGTSTITQQLARNVFLPDVKSERSIKRKIIEMYYAYEIEKELSKEEIVEAYLNTIYLGYGCYGVNAAAKTYYSTTVDKLTLEQCASLAALPQAPDAYALLKSEEGEARTKIKEGCYANDISQDRRYLILNLMAEQELISTKEAEAAKKPLADFIDPDFSSETSASSYFKDYLIETVVNDLSEEYGWTKEEARNIVYTQGLKIYSTLDAQAQSVIAKEFKNSANFPKDKNGNLPEAAMVITEVGTGEVKAMAGGRDPKGQMLFNRATNARQPGSSIKPLAVYSAALQKSLELEAKNQSYEYNSYASTKTWGKYITTSSAVSDTQMTVDGRTWPYNASGTFTGANTFRTALQQSINTCAVKILMQVGVDYSMELLQSYGISTTVSDKNTDPNDMNLASLALGGMTNGVTPLEMSLAYAAFPNGGVVNTAICYTKVEDREGKVLLTSQSDTTQVIDEGVAWIMTDCLQSVITDGIAGAAKLDGVKAGGKTGTTNDCYDIWFDGFTANYSASLWIGTDKNVELTSMSGPAAALWGKIMNQVKACKKGSYKKMPSNVIKSGSYYYTKGTEPKEEVEVNDDGSIKTEEDSAPHGYDEGEGTEN